MTSKKICLIMTKGISLSQWRDSGLLYRELSLYEKIFLDYGIKTQIITYGGKEDIEIIRPYRGLTVLCNRFNLSMDQYIQYLPWLHYSAIRKSTFLKTNQVKGAEIVKKIADITNIPVLARCGFVQSTLMNNAAMYDEQLYNSVLKSEKILFSLAKKIVVTSEELQQYIAIKHQIDLQSIKVIPNFIDTDVFHPNSNRHNSTRKNILFVGRFAPQKNLINFLKACHGLDVNIKFIGQGSLQNDLIQLAQKLNISLSIIPPVPNNVLPKYLNEADIFVLVSHSEGNPKTLIEAMSCGLPVLGANSPGISNIIHHGVDGWLCETDFVSIHNALAKLIKDEALCESLGKNAREATVRNNSLQHIILKEYETYTELFDIPISSESINSIFKNIIQIIRVYFIGYRNQFNILVRCNLKNSIKNIISKFLVFISSPWITNILFLDMLARQKPDKTIALQRYVSNKIIDKEATKSIVINHINNILQNSSADESLKFLFELENWMYKQEGKKSVEYNHGLHTKHRHINYYRFFTDHVRDGQSIVDLGCGNGALTAQVAHKTSSQILGIDFSENNINNAKQNFSMENITYQLGDIYTDLPNQHFDIVIMSNVLEHLEDRVGILQTIMERIEPNLYLIRVPLFERDWRVPLKKELGLDYRLDPTHYIEYTIETFHDEITKAGLIIESQEIRWGEIWAVLKKE